MITDFERLAAARQMLAYLGVKLTDLLPLDSTGRVVPTVPTLGEYLPQVIAPAGSGALHTYRTYWTRMATTWGDRRLDQITASGAPPPRPRGSGASAATAAMLVNTSSPQPARFTTVPSPTT